MPKMILDEGTVKLDGKKYRIDVFLDTFERLLESLEDVS